MIKLSLQSSIVDLTLKYCLLLTLILIGNVLIAQKNNDSFELANFEIIIETTDNGIKLQSIAGSAWKELSFDLSYDQSQAVNEFGMTNLGTTSTYEDPRLTRYLFTITRTRNGIHLEGIEGIGWTELSFSLDKNETQAINELGMTR